ncbi:OLC1v1038853C1 [Oldenlandia corymbosa var. corymbosa]|uniref:OLC1v1038853C1 n=1 Tax=Oldenlandia corymbosa var. corymbosa TaxID=529605 RepID=A0AAV1D1Q3_OLDCO|nr:OLC1v1038853C1 [Oldenlandia corymbosa var. corymbosa]
MEAFSGVLMCYTSVESSSSLLGRTRGSRTRYGRGSSKNAEEAQISGNGGHGFYSSPPPRPEKYHLGPLPQFLKERYSRLFSVPSGRFNPRKWMEYFRVMHNSRGFDIDTESLPVKTTKPKIKPCDLSKAKVADSIFEMSQKCIHLYNTTNPDYPYSCLIIPSLVAFLGEYVVYPDSCAETPMAVFCQMKSVVLEDWEKVKYTSKCRLACCSTAAFGGALSQYRPGPRTNQQARKSTGS